MIKDKFEELKINNLELSKLQESDKKLKSEISEKLCNYIIYNSEGRGGFGDKRDIRECTILSIKGNTIKVVFDVRLVSYVTGEVYKTHSNYYDVDYDDFENYTTKDISKKLVNIFGY